MTIRYKMFPGTQGEDERDEYMRLLADNFTRTMVLVGIRRIELERLSANDITKGIVKAVEYQPFATDGIRTYAEMMLSHICDGFSTLGIAIVEVEMLDDEAKRYGELFRLTSDVALDKDEATDLLNKAREAANLQQEELGRKAALREGSVDTGDGTPSRVTPPNAEGSGGGRQISYSEALTQLYMGVADMLPVEGRDYALNPSPGTNGGIHMDPVAYTQIGKIWLEYLADALPAYAKLSREEREEMLEARISGREDNENGN